MIKNLISKTNISLFCFLFINCIYGLKYFCRYTEYSFLIALALLLVYLLVWKSRFLICNLNKNLNWINLLIIALFIIGFAIVFQKVPVETLKIDRWSVISSFWNNYFNDKYVYFAKSFDGNYPGPMPFYFILALPFYLIGEIGYFSILGLILFYFLLKKRKISEDFQTVLILLILGSAFYLHEVIGRSNLFLNSTLVLTALNFYFGKNELKLKKIILSGILVGLIISTRNVLVIPFIIAFVFELKNNSINFKQILILGLIAILTFLITFLPFVWNHFDDFLIMNPFIIQSSGLIPFKYTLVFISMAFIFGLQCKNQKEIYFYSGLNLFLSIIIYFLYYFNEIGSNKTFYESSSDITYFVLCIPFFLFYLALDSNAKTSSN